MKINLGRQGSVTIDGRDFVGRNITINGNRVTVDGVVQDGTLTGPISVTVHGDVSHLEASGDVTVNGHCEQVQTVSGDVHCADVRGSIKTVSGDVTCGKVAGSVNALSGDINGRAAL